LLESTLTPLKEEFEDTKGVIRIRNSKKDRQHNGQKKKDKRTNNDLQKIHIKLTSGAGTVNHSGAHEFTPGF
jgi:hypothetical protein